MRALQARSSAPMKASFAVAADVERAISQEAVTALQRHTRQYHFFDCCRLYRIGGLLEIKSWFRLGKFAPSRGMSGCIQKIQDDSLARASFAISGQEKKGDGKARHVERGLAERKSLSLCTAPCSAVTYHICSRQEPHDSDTLPLEPLQRCMTDSP